MFLVFFWMIFYVSSNEGDPSAFAKFGLGIFVSTIALAFKIHERHPLIGKQLALIGVGGAISAAGFLSIAFALPGFRSMPSDTTTFTFNFPIGPRPGSDFTRGVRRWIIFLHDRSSRAKHFARTRMNPMISSL